MILLGETIALVLQIRIISLVYKKLETISLLPLRKALILPTQSPQDLPWITPLSWVLPRGISSTNLLCKIDGRTSLVAQWLRICLPMQGTRVRALVWEDPTCLRATKPVHHNY